MSKPSFSNIDLWLFELAEGNLSPAQIEHLELFLLQNPDLDIERDMWEFARVENTPLVYSDAAALERNRRPVAVYFGSLLLLLLIGIGSYGIWSILAGIEKEGDLMTEVRLKQIKLEKEVNYLRIELSKRSQDSNLDQNSISLNKSYSLSLSRIFSNPIFNFNIAGVPSNENAPFFKNANNSWFASNAFANSNAIQNAANKVYKKTIWDKFEQHPSRSNSNLLLANATPLEKLNSSENNQNRESSSTRVGRKDFHTRPASQIDYTGKHRWVERSQSKDYGSLKGGDVNRLSFGKRIKRISRMIRRMADNPIALRNSRDPHYHVPGLTSNDISFSSAGTLISTKVQSMSRIQWLGEENEQLINEVAVDGYAYGIRGGWGIQLNHSMYDDGGIHIGQMAFTYSPKFSVNNWFSVEPSVRFKMGDKLLNAEMLDGLSQVELDRGTAHSFFPGEASIIGRNLWYKDLGVGLLVNTKWFFAGIQADNLFRHNDNIYSDDWSSPRRAGNHIIATIGTDWLSVHEDLGLSPYVVYQKKDDLSEVWLGVNFKWDYLNLGIATSEKFDPSASIGIKLEQFSLHYNADYTTSAMTGERALSHQVTMRIQTKISRSGMRLNKL